MPDVEVKLFGERNTGTRYLSRLLELNLQVVMVNAEPPDWVKLMQRHLPGHEWLRDAYFDWAAPKNLGWKHCLPDPVSLAEWTHDRSMRYLTLTKNPYAWLVSLYRRPHHQHWREKPTFDAFLRQPWRTVKREGMDGRPFPTPMDLWNSKNGAYAKLGQHLEVYNLTYEHLINDPAVVVEEIAGQFNVERANSAFQNIERSTKKSRMTHSDYRRYYESEVWRENLSADHLNIINAHLDPTVLSHFGYSILSGL